MCIYTLPQKLSNLMKRIQSFSAYNRFDNFTPHPQKSCQISCSTYNPAVSSTDLTTLILYALSTDLTTLYTTQKLSNLQKRLQPICAFKRFDNFDPVFNRFDNFILVSRNYLMRKHYRIIISSYQII